MAQKWKVWLVDDLPENLERFRSNHGSHFDVETFSNPGEVLSRINNKEYPDALLCDVFFYDSVDEARDVERKIKDLAEELQKTAADIGANDHARALGITLMRRIFEHFGESGPRFPIYAYTSKGPFLLEQSEWENLSKYGVQILLKNRITPDAEWTEIEGDIAISKREVSPPAEALRGSFIFAGNVFDAMMKFGDVLRTAKKDVLLVDPYMDEIALNDFALMIPEQVQVRLLSDAYSVKETLRPACARWGPIWSIGAEKLSEAFSAATPSGVICACYL